MPEPPFRPSRPGQSIPHELMNRLHAVIMRNARMVGLAPVRVEPPGGGRRRRISLETGISSPWFNARLLGAGGPGTGANPYSFEEVIPDESEPDRWAAVAGGIVGEDDAYDINSKVGLVGKVVEMRRDSFGNYRFQYVRVTNEKPCDTGITFCVGPCVGLGDPDPGEPTITLYLPSGTEHEDSPQPAVYDPGGRCYAVSFRLKSTGLYHWKIELGGYYTREGDVELTGECEALHVVQPMWRTELTLCVKVVGCPDQGGIPVPLDGVTATLTTSYGGGGSAVTGPHPITGGHGYACVTISPPDTAPGAWHEDWTYHWDVASPPVGYLPWRYPPTGEIPGPGCGIQSVGGGDSSLQVDPSYVCECCGKIRPIPRTLHYSDSNGACPLVWGIRGPWWDGCYFFTPPRTATNQCVEDGSPGMTAVQISLTCGYATTPYATTVRVWYAAKSYAPCNGGGTAGLLTTKVVCWPTPTPPGEFGWTTLGLRPAWAFPPAAVGRTPLDDSSCAHIDFSIALQIPFTGFPLPDSISDMGTFTE